MDFIVIALLAAVTFGICFIADKGFQKAFRSRQQHRSGKAVRLTKKYGAFGMMLVMLGVAGSLAGLQGSWALVVGSVVITLVGVGLITYYLTFGIYYDGESFLYSAFGKKDATYRHGQISHQQLYVLQGGSALLELHMTDGSAVPVQLSLDGAEDFLNTAFLGWVQQNNIDIRDTHFHDPQNSCWFPSREVE